MLMIMLMMMVMMMVMIMLMMMVMMNTIILHFIIFNRTNESSHSKPGGIILNEFESLSRDKDLLFRSPSFHGLQYDLFGKVRGYRFHQ